eukprot:SAG11_NODE_159_length_14027_cov_6.893667_5_plen_147_part_00
MCSSCDGLPGFPENLKSIVGHCSDFGTFFLVISLIRRLISSSSAFSLKSCYSSSVIRNTFLADLWNASSMSRGTLLLPGVDSAGGCTDGPSSPEFLLVSRCSVRGGGSAWDCVFSSFSLFSASVGGPSLLLLRWARVVTGAKTTCP